MRHIHVPVLGTSKAFFEKKNFLTKKEVFFWPKISTSNGKEAQKREIRWKRTIKIALFLAFSIQIYMRLTFALLRRLAQAD